MTEASVVGYNSLSASLSFLLPFPKAPGVSSTSIRLVRRLAVYILSSLRRRLPADSMEMAEHSLRRM